MRPDAVADSVGIDAHRVLRPGVTGRVEAVFARSFYLRLGDDWVCIGNADIGHGPLNVTIAGPGRDWHEEDLAGCAGSFADAALMIGGHRVDLSDAPVWQPADPPEWTQESLARGLLSLSRMLPQDLPAEGLADFARDGGDARSPVARSAREHVATIAAWAASGAAEPLPDGAAGALIGLGPGLTPSGDDFLAGGFAALHATGRAGQARALWGAIEARSGEATVAVSAAHLRCAADGRMAERLHDVLHAVLTGNDASLGPALAAASDLGHNSPWDAIAGFVTLLRAALPRS